MTYYIADRRERVHNTRTCRGLAGAVHVEAVNRSHAMNKRPCAICYPTEDDWDRVIRETRAYALGLYAELRGGNDRA